MREGLSEPPEVMAAEISILRDPATVSIGILPVVKVCVVFAGSLILFVGITGFGTQTAGLRAICLSRLPQPAPLAAFVGFHTDPDTIFPALQIKVKGRIVLTFSFVFIVLVVLVTAFVADPGTKGLEGNPLLRSELAPFVDPATNPATTRSFIPLESKVHVVDTQRTIFLRGSGCGPSRVRKKD